VAAAACEAVGEAVGAQRLQQREARRCLRPGGALVRAVVRNELVNAAEHQRHDAGGEAADD